MSGDGIVKHTVYVYNKIWKICNRTECADGTPKGRGARLREEGKVL